MNDIVPGVAETLSSLIQALKQELMTIRTSRPQAGLIENVPVLYYGESVLLKSLCSISVAPPRELACNVYDKAALPGVVKALTDMQAGFSVQQEGSLVRVFLPELTSERKEEVIKYVRKLSEERRIEARRIRDEAIKTVNDLAQKSELREDDKFKLKEGIQKEIDRMNDEIEKIVSLKEKEICS